MTGMPSLESALAGHRQRIEQQMGRWMQEALARHGEHACCTELLSRTRQVILGGKHLRSFLAGVLYQGLGGREDVAAVLCSLEFLHEYLLVHDDIMDRDRLRRDQDSLWLACENALRDRRLGAASRSRHGLSLAMIAGNYLNALSVRPILQQAMPAARQLRLLRLIWEFQPDIACGQILDIHSSFTMFDADVVEQMYFLKTGSYSIGLPFRFGAVLAGKLNHRLERQIDALAHSLGVAFQYHDDLLSVFYSSEQTGKSADSDLHEKKKTMLLQKALQLCSEAERRKLERIFLKHRLSANDISLVKKCFVDCGALAALNADIHTRLETARAVLARLPVSPACRQLLWDFADYVVNRER